MPIRAPMAEWKPLRGKGTRTLTPEIICVHTMVGTLEGSYSWAAQAGNPYWHFGLGGRGELWQCIDLSYRSAANLEGNDRCIPIETEDRGPGFGDWSGSNVPAWTKAQVDRLVELIVWLCRRFQIPAVLIPDTRPGRRGLGYHRQGIDPWRVQGGELWSKARGKQCPGDRRIRQFVDEVIPAVQAQLQPQPPGDDDLTPEQDELLKKINGMIDQSYYKRPEVNSALDDIAGRVGVGTDASMASVDDKLDRVIQLLEGLVATPPPPT